jgi:FAD/FMN-containing dehydrogenase
MIRWTNWAGNLQCEPDAIARPGTLDELRAAVVEAAGRKQSIRAAGSGHSFAPLCQTDGLLIDLSDLAGIDLIDPETGDATVWAGTKIHALGEPLFRAGRALANQGDIDRQALAGAVSTGTHGTGRRFGSFSNAVREIELMTREGDLVTIDAASPAGYLRAAALSLGMLGIITRLTLSTVSAYKLREQNRALDFDACLEVYPGIEATHRNAEFWWIPPLDACVIKTLVETNEEPFGHAETDHPPGTIERYLKPDTVDWSYRIYPSTRSQPFVECEYTLPIVNGPGALREIRSLMRTRHADVRWAVEYRTMAGEAHLLSPTAGQDSVTISVHQAAGLPWEAFMRDCDALFREHGGRPHWGKLHWLTRQDIDDRYPDVETFRRVRAELDPGGIFLNDSLRELFA